MNLMKISNEIINAIGLMSQPGGVKFYEENSNLEQNVTIDCRFCQALMEARKDNIIIEDEVEKLIWLALVYLNEEGGRLEFSTSIMQAICVDVCVLPCLSGKINMSFGCYGCRDATDVKSGETVIGIPFSKLKVVNENLNYLKSQAIDRSRAKKFINVL